MPQTGPQPITHEERLANAQKIASQLLAKFGNEVRAIGAYGSLARGTDGPYSDIEMFCIVRSPEVDTIYEWCEGAWKAEVDVQSAEVLLDWAKELESDWSLTHGCLLYILPFYDPENLFAQLKEVVFSHPPEAYNTVIAQFIVDDVFELMGKLRNAIYTSNRPAVPSLAITLTKAGAFIIGLANRHLYSTSSNILPESLSLPNRPAGYDALCKFVMDGDLSSAAITANLAENFWAGLEAWAKSRGLKIYSSLDDILDRQGIEK